jgi:hypothetical protein
MKMLVALAAAAIAFCFSPTSADAQRYRVFCAAPGGAWCQIGCGSNTRAVACRAQIMPNGRCFKRCVKM